MSIKNLGKGLTLLVALILVGCGSDGGGSGTPPATITSFELFDPTPGAGDEFGRWVTILSNGNIVVSDPNDSTIAVDNGAVHLYNPISRNLIASIYGDGANDRLGFINNSTSGVVGLANGNYVIASSRDTVGGIIEAGSVRLMNGSTGAQIGGAIVGDTANDLLGFDGITALANSNFVIASSFDNEGGITNSGSVRLVNGSTGAQIGSAIFGNLANDRLGSDGTTALTNNNYVIASSQDDVGGNINAGSVRLVDGSTGAQIGSAIVGDLANDQLGFDGTTALTNGNYAIASSLDTENGISNAGSVRLADGAKGTQIGAAIVGDNVSDRIGSAGITALTNANYVIASPLDDALVSNAGSVRLMNGTTGVPIGTAMTGDKAGDELGSDGITALPHHYYVIASSIDDERGVLNAGSVRLVNGVTGTPIGTPVVGDIANDRLGSKGTTALPNGDFVIGSPNDTEGGIVAAGSVRLVDGLTSAETGNAILGATASDSMGFDGTTALASNNYVTVTRFEDVNGVVNSGSIRLVNGVTGSQIGNTIAGKVADDMNGAIVVGSSSGDYFVVGLGMADNSGLVDSGFVYLIVE